MKNSTAYYGTIKTGLNLMLEETEESWPNIYGYKMPDGNIFYYHNVFFKTKDEIPRIMSENDRIGKYARPLAQEFDLIKQCSEHGKFISDEKNAQFVIRNLILYEQAISPMNRKDEGPQQTCDIITSISQG